MNKPKEIWVNALPTNTYHLQEFATTKHGLTQRTKYILYSEHQAALDALQLARDMITRYRNRSLGGNPCPIGWLDTADKVNKAIDPVWGE